MGVIGAIYCLRLCTSASGHRLSRTPNRLRDKSNVYGRTACNRQNTARLGELSLRSWPSHSSFNTLCAALLMKHCLDAIDAIQLLARSGRRVLRSLG